MVADVEEVDQVDHFQVPPEVVVVVVVLVVTVREVGTQMIQ